MPAIGPRNRDRWARGARGVREAALLWWRWYARRPRPRGITVSVTSRCDLRCRHCERGVPDSAPVELSLDIMRCLIDLAKDLRVGLLLTGGEPSLHPDFRAVLEYARLRGVRVELNTNGYALADADASMMDSLNASVDLMRISLDSADPEEHDTWRGVPGSQAKALQLLRDRRLTCRREISTVLAVDLHNAGPLVEMARDAHCRVTFQPLIFGTNVPDLPRRPWKAAQQQAMPDLAARVLPEIIDLRRDAQRLGVPTNLATLQAILGDYYRAACGPDFFGDGVLPRFRCVIPYQRLTVDECGRLAPCAFMPGSMTLCARNVLQQWEEAASAWRNDDSPLVRTSACRSCVCYFAENERASAALSPFANRRRLLTLLRDHTRPKPPSGTAS